MQLFAEGDTLYCKCSYSSNQIPKQFGFQWNNIRKAWYSDDTKKKEALKSHVDIPVQEVVVKVTQARQDIIDMSMASDSDLVIPAPPGLSYLPYQKAGIEYALQRKGTIIGDDMGLGKTVQAIGLCNYMTAKSVLVVCPASLKLNWKKEMIKWLVDKSLIVEYATSKVYPLWADVVIINYDIMKKHRDLIRKRSYDVMVVDESHNIKNGKALRTKEVIGAKRPLIPVIEASRYLLLTGTPILNNPKELWTSIHFLAPSVFDNEWAFLKRYCGMKDSRYGKKEYSTTNLEELQQKLRSTVMVRRLKADVLKELPQKIRQVIEVPATGKIAEVIAQEQQELNMIKANLENLKRLVEQAERNKDSAGFRSAVKGLSQGEIGSISLIAKLRKLTALAKVHTLIEYLQDTLQQGQKVVVFAHHKEVIAKLMEAFPNAVKVTGSDSAEARDQAVGSFQEDPNTKMFIGSIKAAGVGLTLTAASLVLFAELDWTPASIQQCEDRCHRIGQKDTVFAQHFVLEGSIDATMANKIVDKLEMIERTLDYDTDLLTLPVLPI